jgi:hydrogenase 3 maturation protease
VALEVAASLEGFSRPFGRFELFVGGTTPENLTGPMRRFGPGHLLVLDAAELGAAPGSIELLAPERLQQMTFCTHALPLQTIIDYVLTASPGCGITLVGIQPKHLELGRPLSPELREAASHLVTMLTVALSAP